MFLFVYTRCGSRGRGGAPGAPPPPKIGTNMIFWRKIVIFHTKYPKHFAPPSAIGKNMIFWRKIVIFHTKYSPKKIKCATLEHIIPILSQTLILIAPAFLAKTQFLARLNRHLNHDLPHSRRAR